MTDSEILDLPEFESEFNALVALLFEAKCHPVTENELSQALEIAVQRVRRKFSPDTHLMNFSTVAD